MDIFNKYNKNKKSQLLIISTLLFVLLLLFIYSQETENFYISKTSKTDILDNLVYETCQVAKMSNGTYIDSRLANFSSSSLSYCNSYNYSCTLSVLKDPLAPSNQTYLNYSYYNFSILYSSSDFSQKLNFTC